jgi:hypothetical protein
MKTESTWNNSQSTPYLKNLLPTTTVAGCVDIFKNVWPNFKETIEDVEKECMDSNSGIFWSKARVIGQTPLQKERTNYHLGITRLAENGSLIAQKIHTQMNKLLIESTNLYSQKHKIGQLWHEKYDLLRYKTNQEYKSHYDGKTITGRSVSAILYLNNNYEGGHIEFTNFGVKIKPEPGMLLLFPSNYAYTHIAHPVTEGTKYAIVTWLRDRSL